MTYSEIEKFADFSKGLIVKHLLNKGFKERKDLLDSIQEYNLNPALEEMQVNFRTYVGNKEITEILIQDYQNLINTIDENTSLYPEREQRFFQSKLKRVKMQLESKTIPARFFIKKDPETSGAEVNPYPKIFSNTLGYSVFLKMHGLYKDENHVLANYSFLFLALEKENLIVCRNIDWIKFLSEKFEIEIDKVDRRKTGDHKRNSLFQAIKKTCAEKAQ